MPHQIIQNLPQGKTSYIVGVIPVHDAQESSTIAGHHEHCEIGIILHLQIQVQLQEQCVSPLLYLDFEFHHVAPLEGVGRTRVLFPPRVSGPLVYRLWRT